MTYVKDVRDGRDPEAALDMMRSVYEKMLSVCPKCGRTLSAPGAPCVYCMKKGRLFRRLVQYLKPETPILVISVIISILTTAVAYVYETRLFNSKRLIACRSTKSSIALLCIVFVVFVLFTFFTPELNIFRDPLTGEYGI